MYVWYLVNGCVMVLIIIVFLTSEQGSISKWENGWPAKWARRLEAEVSGIWSSKGESKGRDWNFEEARGEIFLLWVHRAVLAVQWTCYRVTCLFFFGLFIEWLDKWRWAVMCAWILIYDEYLWPILRKHILWHIAFQTARKGPNRILKKYAEINNLNILWRIKLSATSCPSHHHIAWVKKIMTFSILCGTCTVIQAYYFVTFFGID